MVETQWLNQVLYRCLTLSTVMSSSMYAWILILSPSSPLAGTQPGVGYGARGMGVCDIIGPV